MGPDIPPCSPEQPLAHTGFCATKPSFHLPLPPLRPGSPQLTEPDFAVKRFRTSSRKLKSPIPCQTDLIQPPKSPVAPARSLEQVEACPAPSFCQQVPGHRPWHSVSRLTPELPPPESAPFPQAGSGSMCVALRGRCRLRRRHTQRPAFAPDSWRCPVRGERGRGFHRAGKVPWLLTLLS